MENWKTLLARTQSLSLKRRQQILLLSIFAIILTLGLGLIGSLHMMQGAFEQTIQGEMALKMRFEELRRSLLELDRNEKDFFNTTDETVLKASDQVYEDLKAQVEQLQIQDRTNRTETLAAIESGFSLYKKSFDAATTVYLKIAHPITGQRETIRTFM